MPDKAEVAVAIIKFGTLIFCLFKNRIWKSKKTNIGKNNNLRCSHVLSLIGANNETHLLFPDHSNTKWSRVPVISVKIQPKINWFFITVLFPIELFSIRIRIIFTYFLFLFVLRACFCVQKVFSQQKHIIFWLCIHTKY